VAARNSADIAAHDLARNERLLAAGAVAERDIEQSRRASIAAQAALEDANSRLASAEKMYRSTTVTAPFGGIVSERPVSSGDIVQPGTSMFTVVDPSSMRLEASVQAEQLSAIKVGVPVTFTVSGYPGRDCGRIVRVNPTRIHDASGAHLRFVERGADTCWRTVRREGVDSVGGRTGGSDRGRRCAWDFTVGDADKGW
jgi:multidrug resistance efflux pump